MKIAHNCYTSEHYSFCRNANFENEMLYNIDFEPQTSRNGKKSSMKSTVCGNTRLVIGPGITTITSLNLMLLRRPYMLKGN